jgi:hypothetical protein
MITTRLIKETETAITVEFVSDTGTVLDTKTFNLNSTDSTTVLIETERKKLENN